MSVFYSLKLFGKYKQVETKP